MAGRINADFNQDGNSVFENVYIHGELDYEFDLLQTTDLIVDRYSWHGGIATFKDDVIIEGRLDINYLTVNKEFEVGAGGTIFSVRDYGEIPHTDGSSPIRTGTVGIGTTLPIERFQVGSSGIASDSVFVVTGFGTVGIGTTNPFGNWTVAVDPSEFNNDTQGKLNLRVDETISIGRNIYDSANSPGINGYFLKRDLKGIRWTPVPPSTEQDGILIQDEGIDVPIGYTAQQFSTLNFVQRNSFGQGTDTLEPTAQNDATPTGLATIFTNDLWGYNGTGNAASIYRQSKVGIKNSSPTSDLDITGTVHATGNVDFDVQLNVDGATTLNSTLDVDLNTDLHANLTVDLNTLLKGTLNVNQDTDLDQKLNVDGDTTLKETLIVDGDSTFKDNLTIIADNKYFKVKNSSNVDKFTIDTDNGDAYGYGTLEIDGKVNFNDINEALSKTDGGSLTVDGGTAIAKNLIVGTTAKIESTLDSTTPITGALQVAGGAGFKLQINVGSGASIAGITTVGNIANSSNLSNGALQVKGGASIVKNLNVGGGATVGGAATISGILELDSHLKDKNDDIGVGIAKTDYRLASVGTGVSWRPSGVQTKNAIWVSMNGLDSNSGLLEGDAKQTIGGAAAIAQTGDTIIVRSGVYKENNPIGLRTEVTVSGEDLRLVTVVPLNVNKDVFQVRAGCLIQNMNFAGVTSPTNHPRCGAVAFPPTAEGVATGLDYQAETGYTALGPANQGPDRVDPTKGGRWRSPYVRNCTNFMTGSIGMKIDGDYVNAAFTGTNDLGQDLKSMVCDSFTQYNENGIGVSLTNNAYAQLVSIFTIGCDVAIFAGSGGQCDLTNSNSSFGNFGLKADGVGDVEFIGTTDSSTISGEDVFIINSVTDTAGNFRKPFDGQGAYFHINLDDYPDTNATGIMTQPLQFVRSIEIIDGGNGYNQGAPPVVTVQSPQGPESILPEFSANVSAAGSISSVDVIASGRNFLPTQELTVTFSSGNATGKVNTDPILYTVSEATEPVAQTGLSTVTFNEFIPYAVGVGVTSEFVRLSRIITSSHSFEYVGAGTDLNRANPFQGGEPIPENEIVSINGGQVPYTSTDQKGNFRIGDGLTIDQTTSTIRGRDFNRAIQAQLTPLILALR